ncbi:MAG: DUF2281 domain-containing protein [Magnetococcales bacterium]|nr:DUF2281 domain-containing protein [Magnetococcales bacterium]
MNTAERIYAEIKRLPEDLVDRVLDFVLFLEQRHLLTDQMPNQESHASEIRRLAEAAQWSFPALGREEAAREAAALRGVWDRQP